LGGAGCLQLVSMGWGCFCSRVDSFDAKFV
jgi:hypothetical protein